MLVNDKRALHHNRICNFSEAAHTYTIEETGERLASVTTVIKQFTPPFDAPVMAERMVKNKNEKYLGMTAGEIQKLWSDKARTASFEGTKIHAFAENFAIQGGEGFKNESHKVLKKCRQVRFVFRDVLSKLELVETEKLVFSETLGIAGQIDLMARDPKTNEYFILDYKTNARITGEDQAFGEFLPPIDHLKKCDVRSP